MLCSGQFIPFGSHGFNIIGLIAAPCLFCTDNPYFFSHLTFFACQSANCRHHRFFFSPHDCHLSRGCIMPIFHAGCFGPLGRFFHNRSRCLHRHPHNILQHFLRNITGSEHSRPVRCQIHNGRLQTDTCRTSVQQHLDPAVHILPHMLCQCWTGAP